MSVVSNGRGFGRIAAIQSWTQDALQRAFGLYVYRKPPFGVDSFAQIRRLRDWADDDVIFDVGANDGRSVERLRRYFPSQTIHSFEPVLATFERMVDRTQGWPGVHHHRMALGAAPGEQAIHVGESSVLSSFIETDVWEPSGTEMVPVSTIDRMMEQLRIPRVHLLKVDTEGYEVEVLRGASQSLAAGSIDIIQVEAGFGQDTGPHVPLELLKSHVAAFGFSLLGIFNQCRAPERQRNAADGGTGTRVPGVLSYCDAVFVRDAVLRNTFARRA